ncbi:RdRP-domain-containing protein [Laetiporus sulphureus 93-53]|uniref:RNA-dependent RNA polymerase n=1 Tax=Laetiporus sulphureus 93-53 TaxID=1314785 RepID=A0A165EEG3_9APHY|nr:RdRP-domain-containing protein [Laetiporus sulphureus 93-53]KZT06877.1 RdRP-domain-containing protein [Laetiporus sulphureus 93-53]
MDIFMCNLPMSLTPNQLKIRIATELHSPDFGRRTAGNNPINFEVRISNKKGRAPVGFLTVPTIEIGQEFLEEYGGNTSQKPIVIGGSRIKFLPGKREAKEDVLEMIRRLPYIDPRMIEERDAQANELQSHAVSVSTLQFGWVCRDNIFSIEWEKQCAIRGSMAYNEDRREFRIKVPDVKQSRIIAIRAAQVYWLGAAPDGTRDGMRMPVLFFHLNHPPSFEIEPDQSELIALLANLFTRANAPTRHRWTSFDDTHAEIAPYTSLALRIVCTSQADLDTFQYFRDIAHMTCHDYTYSVQKRDLFSSTVRHMYSSWIADLDWKVAFQVEALSRSYLIDMKELLSLRPRIEQMVEARGTAMTSTFLRDFGSELKATLWYGDGSEIPVDAVEQFFSRSWRRYLQSPIAPIQPISTDNFECLRVIVTPTTSYLEGPFPERSNRVMRRYVANQDSFLRVSFVDETRLTHRFDREVDGRTFINRTVKHLLVHGMTVAGRHFDFLAYSQSALKEHSVWFVKEFVHIDGTTVNATTIRKSLGSFRDLAFDPQLIYCPARYAARMSQAFTTTDSSIAIEPEEVMPLDDVMDSEDRYCFTDGVGTLSAELAREIWMELRLKRRRARRTKTYPRLFQIRFMGSKGMLSVDYTLKGRSICLRPSMIKFDSPNSMEVEIARAFDKPGPYYLNRPLIMLLEGLGVPYEVFLALQEDAVRRAQGAVKSLELSARLLEAYGLGASYRLTSTMLHLHRLSIGPLKKDIFWQQMMDFAVNHVLRELKHHARIPVPQGWTVVGVADVHGYLEEGQIFVCIDSQDQNEPFYLEGPVLISRSPTIHPGDVQIVHAIGRPPPGSPFQKESLPNSVVFSIKGARPLPSCLGGGDLDGDVYNVTTMPDLHPRRTYAAASYDPAKRKTVDHESTIEDVADFVAEYINSDTLGIIAINWLIIADQSSQGILDPDCLRLAQLHSDAVDYPKSGNPVPLDRIPQLKFRAKPDWNAPETLVRESPRYYESNRAIGRLFREIELPALRTATKASRAQRRHLKDGQEFDLADIVQEFQSYEPREDNYVQLTVEHRISEYIPIPEDVDVEESLIETMWELFRSYSAQLRTICADHTLSYSRDAMLTEEEAVVGTIVARSSQPRRRKDMMSQLREQTASLVESVRAGISGDDDTPSEESLLRAWIAYKVALIQDDYFGARSFAWIALGEAFDAIKDIEQEDQRLLR